MEVLNVIKWPVTLLLLVLIFKKEIAEFLRESNSFKTKWFELGRIREEVFAKADEVKQLSNKLNRDKKELRKSIRIFIESLYLTLSTRDKFPIPDKISQQISQNLNLLANLAIKNAGEKKEWKERMDKVSELLEKEVG